MNRATTLAIIALASGAVWAVARPVAARSIAASAGAMRAAATATAASRLPDLGPAPELTGISSWINSPAHSLGSLRGRVVLVKFWTFSCINCMHTLPATRAWYERYHAQGFEIVAVHTPELANERVPANVAAAVRRQSVRYPVALDPEFATWNAYHNRYWPAVYLVDAKGHIRYTHIGEGAYDATEHAIQALLAERDS